MGETSPSSAGLASRSVQSTADLSKAGLAAAVGAFVIWGLFPLYLHGLTSVSALQITAHRVAWSCAFILAWMAARGELPKIRVALARPGLLKRLVASAILITINWLAFVWAVNLNHVSEVSLGYYISPLVNVVLGIVVLSERLNRLQWVAVALAAAGVGYLTFETGHVPWAALTVATSFALYGLIRKTASVDAIPGLAIEMILLTPLAVGYLVWCQISGTGALGHSSGTIDLLLIVSGLVTAVPLALFSFGARQIPYSTVGVIQYIGPSLQLACAVLAFGEAFTRGRAVGFGLIWMALLVYAADGIWRARRVIRG
jgi:chloramphenicol-sensitive protein RarD